MWGDPWGCIKCAKWAKNWAIWNGFRRMDGRTDGWMDGRTNGRMDGHSLIEMLGRIEKEKENLLMAETCVWQMD